MTAIKFRPYIKKKELLFFGIRFCAFGPEYSGGGGPTRGFGGIRIPLCFFLLCLCLFSRPPPLQSSCFSLTPCAAPLLRHFIASLSAYSVRHLPPPVIHFYFAYLLHFLSLLFMAITSLGQSSFFLLFLRTSSWNIYSKRRILWGELSTFFFLRKELLDHGVVLFP